MVSFTLYLAGLVWATPLRLPAVFLPALYRIQAQDLGALPQTPIIVSPAAMFYSAHAAEAVTFFVSPKKVTKERRPGEDQTRCRAQLPRTPSLGQGQVSEPGRFCTGDVSRCNCATNASVMLLCSAAASRNRRLRRCGLPAQAWTGPLFKAFRPAGNQNKVERQREMRCLSGPGGRIYHV